MQLLGPRTDPFDLQRFLDAQQGVWQQALGELERGEKRTHWMWFIFPQLLGLGQSATARRFGIRGGAEARAYAAHPVLGARLVEATRAVASVQHRSVAQIFGSPDDLKFHSSMTLFAETAEDNAPFVEAVASRFDGRRDPATMALLGG